MKKKKVIFITMLTILLFSLSMTVVSLFDNVKNTVTQKDIMNNDDIQYHLQYLTLALAKEVDPDYQIFSFDGGVKEQEKQAFMHEFDNVLYNIKELFDNDENLFYSAKSTKTQKEVMNIKEIQDEDYVYDHEFSYNSEGELENDNLFHTEYLHPDYLLSYQFGIIDDHLRGNEYDIPLRSIHLNKPSSFECSIKIPQAIVYSGYVASFIDPWEDCYTFIIIELIVCALIIGLFVLIYPISTVEKINPFLTIKTWKAEFHFFALCIGIFFTGLGSVVVGEYTMTGQLNQFLLKMNLANTDMMLFVLNMIIFGLLFLLITIAWFMVKYMLVYGMVDYLKKQTFFGLIIHYIKEKFNVLVNIDLKDQINKNIFIFVLLNMFMILCLLILKPLGYILLIIYSLLLYFYINQNITKIKMDYMRLLQITNDLGQGHFESEINEDLGLFNSLKRELNQIKIGFEKAVQEETKSQNLKSELISNVSHDLKTPITCIKNYVYLLKDGNLEEEKRNEYFHNLELYTNRLTSLIEDLFEVSKVNSGNIQLNLMNLNIVDLLEQTLAESEDILNSKNLTIIKNDVEQDIQLYLDGDKTYRIFENLLTNIGKYALPNSRVYIDLLEKKQDVCIEFKNISETQMNFTAEEIVERFVRGDKSRHETGSGIGLAIAKSFTEVQNGTFDIQIDGDLFKVTVCFKKNLSD